MNNGCFLIALPFCFAAQLVISYNKAILVQFGVNPNVSTSFVFRKHFALHLCIDTNMQLLPTEEERTIASLLDNAIADAVSEREQFDVLDELDLLEQAEEFIVAANASEEDGRQKRGIERKFDNQVLLITQSSCV